MPTRNIEPQVKQGKAVPRRAKPEDPGLIASIASGKTKPNKFYRHTSILMWKAYLQRQRRWRLLAIETFIGMLLFLLALFIGKPVFLSPLQAEPAPPLSVQNILESMPQDTILGYAPNVEPYDQIMDRAAKALGATIMGAASENGLNMLLSNKSKQGVIKNPIMWIIFKPTAGNKWSFLIRNTERARLANPDEAYSNTHLLTGFLAAQVAVSNAIVDFIAPSPPNLEISLAAMPVSSMMQEEVVKKALSLILMCYTLAFLPAVLETEALVVWETENTFKRALRMRSVGYSSMYLSWLSYTYLTALPVCMLGAIMLILTFRWIHFVTALLVEFAYLTVMAMVAFIMAMFHNKPHIACIWTTLFTLLMTYLAELLVHHNYDKMHMALTFLLQLAVPPLGLINAFNEFALLTIKRETSLGLLTMVASWTMLIIIYFGILLLLQRTIGRQRAIGGQVSWKSIIFKKAQDENEVLRTVQTPTRSELGKVQEVDDLQARAISFRDVCKQIMGRDVLHNVTFDIFRSEYTVLYTEKMQELITETIDNLLTGLALPDSGELIVLGKNMANKPAPLNNMYMVGYCHRSDALVDDLTVHEHFTLFSAICLWHQSTSVHIEYRHIRYKSLLIECNLEEVRHTRVRELDVYYRAQLCWALARLLEPLVIIIPRIYDDPTYRSVIIDKIMKFRHTISIINLDHSSLQLQYADRIFVFCNNMLVFGGTPAYMYYRYGREYRVRLTLRADTVVSPKAAESALLLQRIAEARGTIRAHLGTMLVLKIPLLPTNILADFMKDLTENSAKYGLVASSINLSVPDFQEVVKRAVVEAHVSQFKAFPASEEAMLRAKNALKRIFERPPPVLNKKCSLHFRQMARKFVYFHLSHKFLFIATIALAMMSGFLLGYSFSTSLTYILDNKTGLANKDLLTVEYLEDETILVIRADKSTVAQSIANAYVMSETNATQKQVQKIYYIALPHSEDFREYLMTRAIDSMQNYVYYYAYGIDVYVDSSNKTMVQVLYSPLHKDHGAAARAMARAYMSLIRHYTGILNATITVEDEPFALDLMANMLIQELIRPPLFLQFLLILTISHITLLPSIENGLVRHTQKTAANFSPILYWATLYICDAIFYLILVGIMSIVMIGSMFISAPQSLLSAYDLAILPLTLLLYGFGCVPQAYLFSLGPRVALNLMAFVIVNMVFGETTIVAKLFYGEGLSYALHLMSLSPQFNMAYAYVKVKQIFLYNIECIIVRKQNLCVHNTFHKCCAQCGILQQCFKRKEYFGYDPGILAEIIAMWITATFFTTLLLLNEYKCFKFTWKLIGQKLHKDIPTEHLREGTKREKDRVTQKVNTFRDKHAHIKEDTYGDYLCVENLSTRVSSRHVVRNVYLGLGKGDVLGISGLKRHGRLQLCEVLAGYKLMCNGNAWIMSKWRLDTEPIQYSRNVSICCERTTMPSWMMLTDALMLIGRLRGLSEKDAKRQTTDLIEALEMHHISNTIVGNLKLIDRTRFKFAAAIIAAPPVIILDELTYGQKHSVMRTMYSLLYLLRKTGHSILITSSTTESHIPVTNRLAFMIDGVIYDIDSIDNLIDRHSHRGFTIVVHLKDEVDFVEIFSKYFNSFNINDYSEVLVNVQVYDPELDCNLIFQKMEELVSNCDQIYSYIVTDWTIDYIYENILVNEKGLENATGFLSLNCFKKILSTKLKKTPSQQVLAQLTPFQKKYELVSLIGLPWSVIFQSSDDEPNTT